MPDLIISYLPTATGSRAMLNVNSVTVKYKAKNQGSADAGASTTRFYLSRDSIFGLGDILIGTLTTPALPVGAETPLTTATFKVSVPAYSPWRVIAMADGMNVVSESTEDNNTKTAVLLY